MLILLMNNMYAFLILQLQPLVPVHQFDTLPSYYIFAGLVFVPLTQPYLHEYGEDWYNTSPRRLCERALRELPKRAGEQLVILSQVCFQNYIILSCFYLHKPSGVWRFLNFNELLFQFLHSHDFLISVNISQQLPNNVSSNMLIIPGADCFRKTVSRYRLLLIKKLSIDTRMDSMLENS